MASRVPDAWVEIGSGVSFVFTSWRDVEKAGLIEQHPRPDNGEMCSGGILFDLPGVHEAFPGRPVWTVESLDPLTIHPSLLCTTCGHHGWIKQGKWVKA